MRRDSNNAPERLAYVFVLTVFGVVASAIAWAGFHTDAIRYVEVLRVANGAEAYNAVEIARKSGDAVTLIARSPFAAGQVGDTVRWPVPETVPLHRAQTVRLLDVGTRRVVDLADVSGTSLAAGQHHIELQVEQSLFAGLDYFFQLPLLLIVVSLALLYVLYLVVAPDRDLWWCRRL